MPFRLARLHLRQVENVVDEPGQAFALLHDDTQELAALLDRQVGVVVDDLAEGTDGSERRAQLVADGRDEIVLELVQLLETLVRRSQLFSRGLELPALFLEAAAVHDQLRGFVQDLHHLVDVVHLLPQHRSDHDAGRGGADRAGEMALGIRHDVGVGRARIVEAAVALAGEAKERRVGQRLAHELRQQTAQVPDHGAPAPDPLARRRATEDVYELIGLAALDDGL